jgi:hypothetical protein
MRCRAKHCATILSEITKKAGGKNEARLLKLIIALSQGSLHQERP